LRTSSTERASRYHSAPPPENQPDTGPPALERAIANSYNNTGVDRKQAGDTVEAVEIH